MKKQIWLCAGALFSLAGCTQEHKVIHKLDCVVSSVVYNQKGKVVNIKKETAIENGFVYHFSVQDNGVVIVNDEDSYTLDEEVARSYSLIRDGRVDQKTKFIFNESFNDVRFVILNKGIKYSYTCSGNR